MDRVFLDANVLFSAAYRSHAGLARLWQLGNTVLCSSRYAVAEARANLMEAEQEQRLRRFTSRLQLFDPLTTELPDGLVLPDKDAPIFLAALAAGATHLLTGDIRHFGPYFGQYFGGVLIERPSVYLRRREKG